MSYQVLARKWRPANFAQLVGQEHVVSAISNGLENDRLHHAYLFTGTRGVGKTTIARIFSKSLNCEQGQGANPCGRCATCTEIDRGSYVDLLEIDAASRTKVEDTREILDNVQYKPTRGRYKVYLIDEVHMLSKHSFNALLKTLEEPPPHVKFLLATTDPQKLPVTILSRCLQFNLKALSREQISGQLKHILEQEGIPFQTEALSQLARAAQGSMRDALSLTDQAIAQGNGQVTVPVVVNMLGLMDKNQVLKLLDNLLKGDAEAVMGQVEQMSSQAPDYSQLLSELLSLLHQVALTQLVPQSCKLETVTAKAIYQLAQSSDPEHIQLLYQIAIQARKDLPHAPDGRCGLEMALLRMLAFMPVAQKKSPEFIASAVSHQEAECGSPQDAAEQEAEQSLQRLEDEQALIWQQAAGLRGTQAETPDASPQIEAAPSHSPGQYANQTEALLALRNKLRFAGASVPSAPVKPQPTSVQAVEIVTPAPLRGTPDPEIEPTRPNEEQPSAQDGPPWEDDDLQQVPPWFDEPSLVDASAPNAHEDLISGDGTSSSAALWDSDAPKHDEKGQQSGPAAVIASEAEPEVEDTINASSQKAGDEYEAAPFQDDDPSVLAVDRPIPVFLENGDKVIRPAQIDHWSQLIEQSGVTGLVKQLALHAVGEVDGNLLRLTLHQSKQHLISASASVQLQEALSAVLQRELTLDIALGNPLNTPYALANAIKMARQAHARRVIETDDAVALLKDTFAASVMTQSINPR